MTNDTMPSQPIPFFDLEQADLREILSQYGWPSYRASALYDWVYQKNVLIPSEFTNFSKIDRKKLEENFIFQAGQTAKRQLSEDGTLKLLLKWQDGKLAETVMIPEGDRRTACVSSQVGCPVGCKFCASGVNGLQANLSPGQIVGQIMAINLELAPAQEHVTNVVFMGMGEPLANYANVLKACRILHEPGGLNMGYRRLTISTVGVPPRIRQLADEELPINLAFSLHAPNEELRRQLIPWAEHFDLSEIFSALRYYFDKTGREITMEYILLGGVNDLPEHARQLVKLVRGLRANVNLIRYNEVQGLPFARPDSSAVMAFQNILRDGGINAHVRKSRGRDIDAACGQLRRREESAGAAK